jgi:hypothetical protein
MRYPDANNGTGSHLAEAIAAKRLADHGAAWRSE